MISSGISKYPIIAPMTMTGKMLGISPISPILTLPNTSIISTPMMASEMRNDHTCPRMMYCCMVVNCGRLPTSVQSASGKIRFAVAVMSAISRSASPEL